LFPKTLNAITAKSDAIMAKSLATLNTITAMKATQRTYENTIYALQTIEAEFGEVESVLSLLEMLHPDESIRKKSNEKILKLQSMHSSIVHYFISFLY
jgi:Zn-dependent oligopeptidase